MGRALLLGPQQPGLLGGKGLATGLEIWPGCFPPEQQPGSWAPARALRPQSPQASSDDSVPLTLCPLGQGMTSLSCNAKKQNRLKFDFSLALVRLSSPCLSLKDVYSRGSLENRVCFPVTLSQCKAHLIPAFTQVKLKSGRGSM